MTGRERIPEGERTMNLDDPMPHPEENFGTWLRRMDSDTADLLHQQEPLANLHAAYRVGNAVGSWAVLHEGFKLLQHEHDARRMLMLMLASQTALHDRRQNIAAVDDFLARLDDTPDAEDSDGLA